MKLFYDDCSDPDPLPLWRAIEAGASETDTSRVTHLPGAGPALTKGGAHTDARSLTVLKGDNWHGYGSRAELGLNNVYNTACRYFPGQTTQTTFRFKCGEGFRADLDLWQVILQQKQVAPYGPSPVNAPALTVNLYGNKLRLNIFWNDVLALPFEQDDKWHTLDLYVLHDPRPVSEGGEGMVTMALDGDFPGGYAGPNMVRNAAPDLRPQPSHLRVGLYHHADYDDATLLIGPTAVKLVA